MDPRPLELSAHPILFALLCAPLCFPGCDAAPEPDGDVSGWYVEDAGPSGDAAPDDDADAPGDVDPSDDASLPGDGTATLDGGGIEDGVDDPDGVTATGDAGSGGDAAADDAEVGGDAASDEDAGDGGAGDGGAGDDGAGDDGGSAATCVTDLDCPDIDANLCTDEACDAGLCVVFAGEGKLCDDGNACTDDGCDPTTGCVALPVAATCSDGDLCTTEGSCVDGACVAGPAVSCDDGNVCTDAFCEAATGLCKFPAVTLPTPCDDGEACTLSDACKYGACAGKPRLWQEAWGVVAKPDRAAAVAHHPGIGRFAVAGRTPIVGGYVRTYAVDGALLHTQYFGIELVDVAAINPPEANGAHFVVVGREPNPLGGGLRGFLAKIDKDGKQVLNTKQPLQDGLPHAITPHPKGGWLIAGMAAKSGAAWFAAVDPAGYVTMTAAPGGAAIDQFDALLDVAALPDGSGFALVGTRHLAPADQDGEGPIGEGAPMPLGGQAWLLCVDLAGTKVFETTWGDVGHDDARAVLALPGGDLLVGSTLATPSSGTPSAGELRRFDTTGALIVQTELASLGVLSVDGLAGLDPILAAGAHAMAAVTVDLPSSPPGLYRDAAVVRIDGLAQPLGVARLGSAGDDNQRATAVAPIGPHVEVVVGETRSQGDVAGDAYVATLDVWGNTTCTSGCLLPDGAEVKPGGDGGGGPGGPPPNGAPAPPPSAAPCDDGDPCTFDSCSPFTGACASEPAPLPGCE